MLKHRQRSRPQSLVLCCSSERERYYIRVLPRVLPCSIASSNTSGSTWLQCPSAGVCRCPAPEEKEEKVVAYICTGMCRAKKSMIGFCRLMTAWCTATTRVAMTVSSTQGNHPRRMCPVPTKAVPNQAIQQPRPSVLRCGWSVGGELLIASRRGIE